jgi:TonB family protein
MNAANTLWPKARSLGVGATIGRGQRVASECASGSERRRQEMRRNHEMRLTVLLLILTSACAPNTQRARSVDHGQPARVGSTLHGDEPIKTVQPILPPEAVSRGIVGPVLLEIRIDESGTASVLRVIRGHPLLDSLAKDAVIQWRYRPIVVNGQTVAIIKVVTVSLVAPEGAKRESRR